MQKIGLVLSGGGGKGPYEIGVWRALAELGLDKDIYAVSGTSVGALNAALFAQGDLKIAEASWLSMSPSDILSLDLRTLLAHLAKAGIKPNMAVLSIVSSLALNGVFKRDGLARIIREYLSIPKLQARQMPCYACATELPLFEAKYFNLTTEGSGNITDILLASSAIPIVFPMQKVGSKYYLDGFIKDNTPIQPLVDEGCEIIITVMLSRDDLIPTEKYRSTKIIPIYPQECPGGALSFVDVPKKLQAGYDDAMAVLAPVFELVEINYQYSVELQKYKNQHQQFTRILQSNSSLSDQIHDAGHKLLKEMSKWK